MSEDQADSTVEITLTSQIGYERIAMACSASFAEMFDFPKDRIEDLKTIVAEASINAMQHGLSLIHISEPTRPVGISRMPSSA